MQLKSVRVKRSRLSNKLMRWQRLAACLTLWLAATVVSSALPAAAQDIRYEMSAPTVVLSGVGFEQTVEASVAPSSPLTLEIGGNSYTIAPDDFAPADDGVRVEADVSDVVAPERGTVTMRLSQDGETITEVTTQSISGWLSVLPALLAIVIALVTRQVIPSLFLGVLIGAWMTYGLSITGLWYGLLDTMQVYVLEALVPPDGGKFHMQVVVFTLMMGGMIGIIYTNGGAQAIAARISKLATNRRSGQTATGLLGFAIFFSDYANSLIVGNTMRPVTDRLKISREKLAYIVDSTAAPLATIAIISTWIGFQLGLIEDVMGDISLQEGAYSIFLNALPYNFYPIFALALVFAVALSGRDFGPMAKAERRAHEEGKVLRDNADVDANASEEGGELQVKEGVTARSINAILPILVLIVTVGAGLFFTGEGDSLREIVGSADGGVVLVWAGLLGVLTAALLTIAQRILTVKETVSSWYAGLKSVLFVMIILTLAWSLAAIASDLHTAAFLVSVLGDSIAPQFMPAILFVLAAVVSFSVGTSWGTMGILMPLAIPLTWTIMGSAGVQDEAHLYILYASIGTILAGSVWGDHCSPISDTTIISSVAAGSDHVDHVRTQIPYALLAAGLALVVGLIPTGFGVPWWITLPIGIASTFAVMFIFGSTLEEAEEETDQASGSSRAELSPGE